MNADSSTHTSDSAAATQDQRTGPAINAVASSTVASTPHGAGQPPANRPGDHEAVDQGRGLPFIRLVHVELRKLVDTVAGRWVVGAILLLAALAMAAIWIFADSADLGFEVFLGAAGLPVMLLLPILGILAATNEWTKRTGLFTFTLEPRRIRVALAKLLAALVLGVITLLGAVIIAAVMTVLVGALKDGAGGWAVDARSMSGNLLTGLLGVAQGVGFGMLLGSTPLALVTYFVLPQVLQLLHLWDKAAGVMPWIDLNAATLLLGSGREDGQQL
ncbi:MAG: hypothetical protein Q4P32_04265, partial [Micrococcales bacterium]|nr:hypothetical protein [Micrococcales bacterium]